MLHSKRRWQVTPVATAQDLANKLTDMTWTCCTGFRHNRFLWLNDATSANGAQEYAVVWLADGQSDFGQLCGTQVESVTFGWYTPPELLTPHERREAIYLHNLELIELVEASSVTEPPMRARVIVCIEDPTRHRCGYCV